MATSSASRRCGRLAAAAALIVAVAAPNAAKAEPVAVVVWPHDLDDDVAVAEGVVRDAGHPVVVFAVRDRLRDRAAQAARDDADQLARVEAALAAARAAYLRQDFAGMADGLQRIEIAALPVLARPAHVATLWELELQRGLAELSRRDAGAAHSRFLLALELDAERAPPRDLYGPDVGRAFTAAIDARAGTAARPAAVRASPPDARVVIDGVPVIDRAAPRAVRPGLHVVAASAPGYQPTATILALAPGDAIDVALAVAPGDAVDRLGTGWAEGGIDPDTASGRRAILAVVGELGAGVALFVDVDPRTGEASARVITPTDASPVDRRAGVAVAARAAMARLRSDGSLAPDDRPPPGSRSVLTRWWFWTAIGVVAVAGVGIALAARAEDTVRLHPPP